MPPVRHHRPRVTPVPWIVAGALVLPALASSPVAGQAPVVTSRLPAEGYVDDDAPVELNFDRPLRDDERVAVWIGNQDVTGLFRSTATGIRWDPGVVRLPAGEDELTVFLVTGEEGWREIGSFPLRVRGALGFEESTWAPRLTLGVDGQVAEGHDPDDAAPSRDGYEDLEGELSLETEHVHPAFSLAASATVFGTSYEEKALRFRERGGDAPRVDLAEYAVTARGGPASLTVGHLSTGDQRHLLDRFASRGAELAVDAGSRLHLRAGATGGSRMVGWDDPLGATDPDHRVVNASVGLEALETPGALRVDATWMDGSVLPETGFNQGAVVNAETSRGYGLRVRARGLDRRLTLDAGLSRSTYDVPGDPTVEQEFDVVEVEEETANARYVDAGLDLLRRIPLGSRSANLAVGFRHERIDPLYRSVGAYTRADHLQNEVDLTADVAGVALQGSVSSGENNLDEIPSILKTHTDRAALTVRVPLARVWGSGSSWLPSLQYRLDRTHQFGEEIPVNGGFSESHVPDQVSLDHTASVDWRWSRVSLGYRWNASDQDNRQEGRQEADILGGRNALTLGLTPHTAVSLTVDAGLERSENLERDEVDRTRRLGARVDWRPLDRSALTVRWSDTFSDDEAGTEERSNTTLDAQWASPIPGLGGVGGQYFLRFSRRESARTDSAFDVSDERETWTVTTGFELTLQR